jgi:hypothetical protein
MYSISGNNVEYEGDILGSAEKYLGFDIDAL